MTALVGAGNFQGDGHNDLLSRDSAGNLWLWPEYHNGLHSAAK